MSDIEVSKVVEVDSEVVVDVMDGVVEGSIVAKIKVWVDWLSLSFQSYFVNLGLMSLMWLLSRLKRMKREIWLTLYAKLFLVNLKL